MKTSNSKKQLAELVAACEALGAVLSTAGIEPVVETKPTIEQLAADYRAKLDIATQAQEEADAHRCGAEVALSKLEIAVKEFGFKIEPIAAKQDPELVITDWRDLRVGDEVEIVESHSGERVGRTGAITNFSRTDEKFRVRVCFNGDIGDYEWLSKWRFIRRP